MLNRGVWEGAVKLMFKDGWVQRALRTTDYEIFIHSNEKVQVHPIPFTGWCVYDDGIGSVRSYTVHICITAVYSHWRVWECAALWCRLGWICVTRCRLAWSGCFCLWRFGQLCEEMSDCAFRRWPLMPAVICCCCSLMDVLGAPSAVELWSMLSRQLKSNPVIYGFIIIIPLVTHWK